MVCCVSGVFPSAHAHEGHSHHAEQSYNASEPANAPSDEIRVAESRAALALCRDLIARWPTPMRQRLIDHAWQELQFIESADRALTHDELTVRRDALLADLKATLPSLFIMWTESGPMLRAPHQPLRFCPKLRSPLLVTIGNQTTDDTTIRVAIETQDQRTPQNGTGVAQLRAGATETVLLDWLPHTNFTSKTLPLILTPESEPDNADNIAVPVTLREPATIRGTVREAGQTVSARVTVRCSDGTCRHGGALAARASLTEKPIIYPPLGGWQKTPFFYTDGEFRIAVPPGPIEITVQRGFEHQRTTVSLALQPADVKELDFVCHSISDHAWDGWVSGDTHVHWVTNQWNVDEPIDLLATVQRAEGLRVANNLTLLQRYANEEFIKPSHAGMGPVKPFCGANFHIQMGEEYRNENLYGHLCFLNIDDLVHPIGTGSIIAGPDAFDYPLNRTAIDDCRAQGGISIEAHGTGGNKDVPINVIRNLTDSLDQLEPEMYYRLLDCGFRLPLTNGSDFPARTLGIARAYVKVDAPFSYDRWIEGIRRGRTFTTSGPLIQLSVNSEEIGDVLQVGSETPLSIRATVRSRDPLGRVQIVSNGQIIAEQQTKQKSIELDCTLPAGESRWIVARCSNRSDGRSDWGFGNFNAITGPGVAHTSPVFVQVDGRPRFDAAAAAYWQDRMRMHMADVRGKGRFANKHQLQEAIDYLQTGVEMYAAMDEQVESARSRDETFAQAKKRLANVVRRFRASPLRATVLAKVEASANLTELDKALEPLALFRVSINPESRVKVNAERANLELLAGRPERFLVRIKNIAGTTAPLNLECIDLSTDPPSNAGWCVTEIVDSPFTSRFLTGAQSEWKVVEIQPRVAGLVEVRVTGDVGQGTQDLGFRATADVILNIKSKQPKSAE